jgi:hypothetical protein
MWDSHEKESVVSENSTCSLSFSLNIEVFQCYSTSSDSDMFATLHPAASLPASDSEAVTSLTVHPKGQKRLHHIVMSALVIERQRLLPSRKKVNLRCNNLFNYPMSIDSPETDQSQ